VFRLARVLSGETDTAEGFQGEVVWRDTQMRSLSSTADALVKLRDVGIPAEGLLHRVPEATRTEILEWLRLREQERERLRQERMELLAAGGTVDTQFHDEELP
jgi:cation transport regulator ChaC